MTQVAHTTVAFIGLGAIGGRIAHHLATSDFDLVVHNRSQERQAAWVHLNSSATGVETPAVAAAGADYVITCVGDDADLRAVFYGTDGVLSSLRPGTIVIDHTTASDSIARELAASVAALGGQFVDAPVSGGTAGAENGTLSIMCGGEEGAFKNASRVLSLYGKNVVHIGAAGAGQLCKMVNQICIAGVLEGLAEGIGLADAAGLDVRKVLDAIKGGAAGSWQMENRADYMVRKDYPAGFAARLMYKDLGLSESSSDSYGLNAPMLSVVHSNYHDLLEAGLGDEDFTNLVRLVPPASLKGSVNE